MKPFANQRDMRITTASLNHNIQVIPEAGALNEWHWELQQRQRTIHTRDPLFLAAVAEANARDALRLGCVSTANDYRAQAAAILLEAMIEEEAA